RPRGRAALLLGTERGGDRRGAGRESPDRETRLAQGAGAAPPGVAGARVTSELENLDRDTWRRVEAILDQALELPAEGHAAFLDRACAGDPGLRARVEALLAADGTAGDFLEHPVSAALLDDPGDEPVDPEHGRVIGAWRLVRELGHGGMGTVYLGEREGGAFEQKVAIKVIRQPMPDAGVRARFVREQRILARLEHPGIARLLDGGVTPDGVPFLAMEYVEGEPVTAWCERAGADLRAVLQLFVEICGAVDHAHRNLVVHRDLKPA